MSDIPETYACVDCGVNTAPGCKGRAEAHVDLAILGKVEQTIDDQTEMYIVHDRVWKAAKMESWGGCLCIGCLETRLGRRLKPRTSRPIIHSCPCLERRVS